MADNLSQKSHKTSEKNKYNNSIHRTTSESLRLNDTEKGNSHPTSLQSASHNSRKISSFQITSVTVGSRVSTDAGEDSADDLDESHTDDISRITDLENETPSFSEDTFSKDDVFYNASSASLGCAPVIPTSSQYGLAIVGQDANNTHPGGVPTLNNTDVGEMHVSVTNSGTGSIYNIIGNSKPPEGMKEIQEQVRNERFKVVKIESTEPFRRGRWMCMDYLDHTTTQPSAPHIVNNVDGQNENSNMINVPDSGVVLNDSQHEDSGTLVDMKPPGKDLQLPNSHTQHDPHNFSVASPGQSLTQPLNMMPTPPQPLPTQPASVNVQSPPIELPQQLAQNQSIQSSQQAQAQSMSHIPHPAPSGHPPPSQQTAQPVQQMTQSFPAHQLQQVIAQSQGMPQMQQMQMHQQMPTQQMQQLQNQQAQIQMQGQHLAHNTQQMPNMQQMQQIPQMQSMQSQGQMPQLSGQQAPMQQMQMQQMGNQQVTSQALHTVHPQQSTMQGMPQQVHQMQNQQALPNQQSQMQHIPNQPQIHPMQSQQTHQMQNHLQQMQQIPQMSNQNQGMTQMPPMHQMTSQQSQVNSQSGQVQQQHGMHPQHGIQHGGVQYPQSNPPGMMQQPMPTQTQHMAQQVASQVQSQHSVPQYYQQQAQLPQGQSLSQDVMANIVNTQQGATLPSNLQNLNSQPQGATLPNNLQGMNTQQSSGMHPISQPSQNMSPNLQMMTQPNQNIPMAMDNNQGNMQMPVADPMYMQTSNVNQQIPMNQHIGAQQNIINQQVGSSNTQPQLSMGHVISSQQNMSVGQQAGVINQSNIPGIPPGQSMGQQIPQVSMPQQQTSTPIMQNMVPSAQQNVVQNIPMSIQQNHPSSMQPTVHSVPTSVVQSQSTMHVGMPMGGFNSQANVGSIPQNVTHTMSQTTMTPSIGMQNAVNNPIDIHITQQNICSTATATPPIISNTSSPVVSLLVNSSKSYPPGTGSASSGGDSFGSPVSGVVSHPVNNSVNTVSAVMGGEGGNTESGGGTPASDGVQLQTDGMDSKEETPNNEDSESFSGLAMALGGRSDIRPTSRALSPHCAAHISDSTNTCYSASGTSAVAIDNKIEQAMDLVKSHLMFAVREEVEVLKEKIAELMEKINQLELENSILRQHATQETLAQLSPAPPSPPSGPVS